MTEQASLRGTDAEGDLVEAMARIAAEFLVSLPPELRAGAHRAPFDDPAVEADRIRYGRHTSPPA